jgi:hypothetical protein
METGMGCRLAEQGCGCDVAPPLFQHTRRGSIDVRAVSTIIRP